MSETTQEGASALDTAKLVAAIAIVAGGMFAFYYFEAWPLWARWLLVLAGLGLGALGAYQSFQGRAFWGFVQSSRIELRKVVWRDRDAPSTFHVALLVFAVVALLTLFFWGLDALLSMITRWLTGRGS